MKLASLSRGHRVSDNQDRISLAWAWAGTANSPSAALLQGFASCFSPSESSPLWKSPASLQLKALLSESLTTPGLTSSSGFIWDESIWESTSSSLWSRLLNKKVVVAVARCCHLKFSVFPTWHLLNHCKSSKTVHPTSFHQQHSNDNDLIQNSRVT